MTFPKIDLLSFWFGFILSTVFWLLILRISKLLPKMKKSMAENRRKQESRQNTSREHNIRVYMLRKAQSLHLASSLFPLDKVLIEPFVIAPPDLIPAQNDDESTSPLTTILPYTPEVPELYTDFPVQHVSLEILINSYQYICLSGAPGSGKTTALSVLASRLAETETKMLPIMIPADHLLNTESTAVDLIFETIAASVHGTSVQSVQEILTQAAQNSRLVLIIEDLDELSKADFDKVVERLREIQSALPNARIVTTSGVFYTGMLEESGFFVFTLAPWNREQKTSFIRLWSAAFYEASRSSSQEYFTTLKLRLDKAVLWLLQEEVNLSPMDFTIKVWLSLANSLKYPQKEKLVESYLEYVSDGNVNPEGFIAVAESLIASPTNRISREKIAEILNSRSDYIIRNESKRVSSIEVVETLISNCLFTELPDGILKFQQTGILGYLRSQAGADVPLPAFPDTLSSSLHYSFLVHKATSGTELSEFAAWLDRNDPLLYRNILMGMSWLKSTYPGDQLRNEIFKRSARLLQDPLLPIGLRARFLTYLSQSHDPSILSLLTILKGNRDPGVRELVALGFGMFNDEKAVAGLTELADDESVDVQNAAILSLSRLWTIPSQDALANLIFTADDSIRANACELLALHKPDGHEMLKEIIGTENYLSRKAAISGLRRIKEPWVREVWKK